MYSVHPHIHTVRKAASLIVPKRSDSVTNPSNWSLHMLLLANELKNLLFQQKNKKQLNSKMKMNQLIFVATDDNNMQMVQMSKTLSTKSIRDELCTNAGAD